MPPSDGPGPDYAGISDLKRRLEEAAPSIGAQRRPISDQGVDRAAAMERDDAHLLDRYSLGLIDIAAHYGRAVSLGVVTDGLPLINGLLPAAHIVEAAARAGLEAEPSRVNLARMPDAALPVLAEIAGSGPDIIWSLLRDKKGAVVAAVMSQPGKSHLKANVPLADIRAAGRLRVIRFKPALMSNNRGSDLPAAKPGNWLLAAFASSRRIYAEVIAATFAVNLLALALPLFMMNVYDRVLPNAAVETMWALAIGVILATLFDFLIRVLRSKFIDAAGRRADVRLGNLIFSRLLGARLANAAPSAGVRANTLREYETLRDFFNSLTVSALGDLPFVVLFITMIAVIAGPLALIPLAGIPVLLGAAWLTQLRLARLTEMSFRQTGQKSAVAVEMLIGLETIKAAQAESWAARNWEKAVAEHIRTSNEIRHLSNLGQLTIQASQTIIQIAMIIVGFYMLAAGNLTMGALIASTMLAGRAVQPLGVMSGLIARLYQTRIAYRSLSEIVNAPQERPAGRTMIDCERITGRIVFDDVSFSYEADAQPALSGVSFSISPGEKVAIVGGIGGGKSTILRLLYGLQPPGKGRILVDGIPVGQYDPAALRHHIGLAMQSAELFHGTIRSNITLDNIAVSQAALLEAAEAAAALDWITRLPKGFETPVRERGAGLSGGQRQSVLLARVLARQTLTLLLDEPTSDMDPASEAQVVRYLAASADQRTTIIVTHRPALLEVVDRILVLEGGRLVLDGPKASVLASLRVRAAAKQATSQHNSVKQPGLDQAEAAQPGGSVDRGAGGSRQAPANGQSASPKEGAA